MKDDKTKIVVLIDGEKKAMEVDDLKCFFNYIKNKDIQAIVVGEVNQKNNEIIFEKLFSNDNI